MNPLGNRARAEELARLLDGAVAGPTTATAGYAALATRLRGVAPTLDDALGPRPDFRAALRQRLLAVATVQAAAAVPVAETPTASGLVDRAMTWSRVWGNQRRIAVASGTMAAVVALTGVGIASSRSLPGQPFYGLKRAAEGLQLDLAGSDTDKGTKQLEFAATRLREVRALAEGQGELALGSTGTLASGLAYGGSLSHRISDTLHDFDSETKSGRVLLEGVYRRTGKTAPLRILSTFSAQQQQRLSEIIPELPAGTKAAAHAALILVTDVGSTANQLLAIGTCGTSCNPANGGPTLPVQPGPTPTTSATGGSTPDNNGVPPCTCGQPSATPEPTPAPSPSPSPTSSPSESPTPTPTPTHSPSPGPLPIPIPLPVPLPTIPPTPLPLPAPLPTSLPTILPSLLPGVVTKP